MAIMYWRTHGKKTSSSSKAAGLGAAVLLAFGLTTPGAANSLAAPDSAVTAIASNYVQFRQDIAAIDANGVDSAAETREAHQRLSAHDPETLANGWVAFAALVAADTPAFSKGIEKTLRRNKKDKILAKLASEPRYASTLPGADKAMKAVLETAAGDAARMVALGDKLEQQAYDLQKTAWGVKPATNRSARFEQAKAFAADRPQPATPDLGAVSKRGVVSPALASVADNAWSTSWAGSSAAGVSGAPEAQPMMDKILTLALRYSLNAEDADNSITKSLVKNDKGKRCMNWAKLHLDQCIAATRAPYEEVYCFGRHGINDVAECVGSVAGDAS